MVQQVQPPQGSESHHQAVTQKVALEVEITSNSESGALLLLFW
jgi:hypothetical protein